MELLVSMGDAADDGLCRLVHVDLATAHARELLTWLPPPGLRMPGKGFMGIAWADETRTQLLACAHSAVCRIDATAWRLNGVLHQPCMNDLHHMVIDRDRMWLVNTGADRIDAVDLDGRYLGGWVLEPGWISAARFSGANPSRESWLAANRIGWSGTPGSLHDQPLPPPYEDNADPNRPYSVRKIRDFAHPNHIARVHGRPLVTRFHDRAIQDLSDWSFVVPQTPGHPHDGEAWRDEFWITCTHGLLLAYAIENGRVTARQVDRIDTFQSTGRSGWCRGLVVTPEWLIFGLNAIVETDRSRWCDRPFEETETAIVAIDRRTHREVARVDLSGFGTLPKMFGILPLKDVAAG